MIQIQTGWSQADINDMRAFLAFAIPRAKAKLASRPSHAAWQAIHDAEIVLGRKIGRAGDTRARLKGAELLKMLCKVLMRHASVSS